MSDIRVLFVDDEDALRRAAAQTLELAGLSVDCFDRAEPALAAITRDVPAVVVSDIRMPGKSGVELMREALQRDCDLPVILVTGHGDVDLAVRSMRDGAYDFIEKPYDPERLVETVRRAMDKRRLTLENRTLRAELGAGGADPVAAALLGGSAAMEAVRARARAIAGTDADVVIAGATGTGKEVAARAIHSTSARAERPFVSINCAALPADLVESELFGHAVAAFPGATRERYGKFEHARGGTVFLDEIDSLPAAVQAKLLHAVEDRAVTRLGSHEPVALDVRFIAASKQDLEEAVAQGRFRADLLYRLNVATLTMPPLADRREDIPLLFMSFVYRLALGRGQEAPRVPGAQLDAVSARDWPGNVRELRNAAERFVLGLDTEPVGGENSPARTLGERLATHERALIAASLTAHGGNLKETYQALGISRKALYEKMQRLGLDRDSFRTEEPPAPADGSPE